jgi:hypothetical protein
MYRRTGFATLPLHPGRAPAWLFTRMTRLAREIATHIVADRGAEELLRRLSDPFWFQAFGCVLGFDWHSSGVTTTVTGALKEGLRGVEHELGLYSQGGKGATSRKTPVEIRARCDRLTLDPEPLIYASRMAAKVDSAAVQDGYQLYHHAFFFSGSGHWCVVQQGMSDQTRTARRYHWLSESVRSFVNEPHEAICSDVRAPTLNLVAAEHEPIRTASVELVTASPDRVMEVVSRCVDDLPLFPFKETAAPPVPTSPTLNMPARHGLQLRDFDPRHLRSVLLSTYEQAPKDFETPRAIRLRARRQGWDAVPGRSRQLRPDDRHAASRHGTCPRGSVGQG